MYDIAREVAQWTKLHSVMLSARCIPGKKNILANQLCRPNQVLSTKWFLLPRVFKAVCAVFGRHYLGLFATRANSKLPVYISLVPDSMAWKQDAFQHSWDRMSTNAFPHFDVIRQVLSRVLLSTGLLLVLVAACWSQKEWFTYPNFGICWCSPTCGSFIEVYGHSAFTCGSCPATCQKGRVLLGGCKACGC